MKTEMGRQFFVKIIRFNQNRFIRSGVFMSMQSNGWTNLFNRHSACFRTRHIERHPNTPRYASSYYRLPLLKDKLWTYIIKRPCAYIHVSAGTTSFTSTGSTFSNTKLSLRSTFPTCFCPQTSYIPKE
jgi:hypothetical protein